MAFTHTLRQTASVTAPPPETGNRWPISRNEINSFSSPALGPATTTCACVRGTRAPRERGVTALITETCPVQQ